MTSRVFPRIKKQSGIYKTQREKLLGGRAWITDTVSHTNLDFRDNERVVCLLASSTITT